MKRLLTLVMLGAIVLASCAEPQGIRVADYQNNDVIAYGLSSIDDYKAAKDVIALDSLLDGRQPKFKVLNYNIAELGHVYNGGQTASQFYLAQVDSANFDSKEDYLWAIGVKRGPNGYVLDPNPEFIKVATEDTMDMPDKPIAGMNYKIYGAVVKATKLQGFDDMAAYRPVQISVDLATGQELKKLHLISYDLTNEKEYEMNKAYGSASNELVTVVDWNYGDKFYFETNPIVSMSPQDTASKRLQLVNLMLTENPMDQRPYFVLSMFPPKASKCSSDEISANNGSTGVSMTAAQSGSGLDFKQMRYADPANYNMAIRVPTAELCSTNYQAYLKLVRSGAIGRDPATGKRQESFLISPGYLRQLAPVLYDRYKNRAFKFGQAVSQKQKQTKESEQTLAETLSQIDRRVRQTGRKVDDIDEKVDDIGKQVSGKPEVVFVQNEQGRFVPMIVSPGQSVESALKGDIPESYMAKPAK